MKARFAIAKYVPDLTRMEPRNIGIVVWHKGRTAFKFRDVETLNVIDDKKMYDRWVAFWSTAASKDEIVPYRQEPVSRNSEKFIDALCGTSDSQYLLVDYGFITEKIRTRDLSSVADFLYDELVAEQLSKRESEKQSLAEKCRRIFTDSEIAEHVQSRFKVTCGMFGIQHRIRFDWGSGKDKPQTLFEKVSLKSATSVHDAAIKFHNVISTEILDRGQCAALIDSNEIENDQAKENFELITHLCPIIDLADEERAYSSVAQLVI